MPSLEERLENYMDKLATWQLMKDVDALPGRDGPMNVAVGKGKSKDDRDWMQVFCEDVVEPLCAALLLHIFRLSLTFIRSGSM